MNLAEFIEQFRALPRVRDLPLDFRHSYMEDFYNRLAASDDFHPWQGDRPAPDEVKVLADLMGLKPGLSILDVGCGYGRHALLLAGQYGQKVTGIDVSPGLIRKARQMAEERALSVRYEVCKAVDMAFKDEFDNALIGFNTFSLFHPDDAASVLNNIHRALKPEGVLFLDLDNRPYNCRYGTEYRDWVVEPGGIKLQEAYFHAGPSVEVCRDVYGYPRADHLECFTFFKRIYAAEEITGLLRQCGFIPGTLFGNWDLSDLTDESPKMILAARRAG